MFNLLKTLFKKTNQYKNLQELREFDTLKEFEKSEPQITNKQDDTSDELDNYILCNNNKYKIDCKTKIKLLPTTCYKVSKKERTPNIIVTHWDVALSADSCFNILKRSNISTHFCIDNDGTIYQFVDTNDIAWHAGPTSNDRKLHKDKKLPSWNNNSIGIDFSNSYYVKYQKHYIKNGFGERPVISANVHNRKIGPFLGFYPEQIESYKKLLTLLNKVYNIPLRCPMPLNTICEEAVLGKFNGVINHYNLTRNKIDCAGLDLINILIEVNKDKNG